MTTMPVRIALTSGDTDGIGSEILSKALSDLGPQKDVQFFLWRHPSCPKIDLRRIDKRFKRRTVHDWKSALEAQSSSYKVLVDICSDLTPARWVEISTKAALSEQLHGLVNGPLSKTSIAMSGLKDRGHTDIFRRLCKDFDPVMAFWGKRFHVILASDHIPLSEVSKRVSIDRLRQSLRAATELQSVANTFLTRKKSTRVPVIVVGLNPHAGEEGLIGTEEVERLLPLLQELNIDGTQPIIPGDVAFQNQYRELKPVYVCWYHDQGLIPFKAFHGVTDGCQLTLGLPFARTSVDHGTAKDLFGKGVAKHDSMKLALQCCIWLCRRTKNRNDHKELPR